MPSSPSAIPCTSGESGTMVMITSASRTASATLPAPLAAGGDQLLQRGLTCGCTPMTVWPALTRWPAIGLPMMPRPMKAMVLTMIFLLCSVRSAERSQARLSVVVVGLYSGRRSRSSRRPRSVEVALQVECRRCRARRGRGGRRSARGRSGRRSARGPRRCRRRCWPGGTGRRGSRRCPGSTRSRTAITSSAVRSGYGLGPLTGSTSTVAPILAAACGGQVEVLGAQFVLLPPASRRRPGCRRAR